MKEKLTRKDAQGKDVKAQCDKLANAIASANATSQREAKNKEFDRILDTSTVHHDGFRLDKGVKK
jgi:hypothetical protein